MNKLNWDILWMAKFTIGKLGCAKLTMNGFEWAKYTLGWTKLLWVG